MAYLIIARALAVLESTILSFETGTIRPLVAHVMLWWLGTFWPEPEQHSIQNIKLLVDVCVQLNVHFGNHFLGYLCNYALGSHKYARFDCS